VWSCPSSSPAGRPSPGADSGSESCLPQVATLAPSRPATSCASARGRGGPDPSPGPGPETGLRLESGLSLRPGPAGSSFGPAGRARVGRRPTARRGVARGTPRFGPWDSSARAELCRRRGSAGGEPTRKRPPAGPTPGPGRPSRGRPTSLLVRVRDARLDSEARRPGRGPGSQ
jgi:hypothetical protein